MISSKITDFACESDFYRNCPEIDSGGVSSEISKKFHFDEKSFELNDLIKNVLHLPFKLLFIMNFYQELLFRTDHNETDHTASQGLILILVTLHSRVPYVTYAT